MRHTHFLECVLTNYTGLINFKSGIYLFKNLLYRKGIVIFTKNTKESIYASASLALRQLNH